MTEFIPKYATATVPRYTSYPPATQFHTGIDEAAYVQWLDRIDGTDTLSLYVHVPFCRELCWYCGCHTTVANKPDRVERYLMALLTECRQVAKHVSPAASVHHLHFGGGTPNLLAPEQFARVMQALRSSFTFDPSAEIAVEIDPRGLSDEQITAYAAGGVTRASLGVQDISPDVQILIHRWQPFSVVESAVSRLREAGIRAINADLMYGLPGQTIAHVEKSARTTAKLAPDRFAVFGYAHVPWFKKNQKAIDESRLPGGAERLKQAEAVAKTLIGQGYQPVGLDHFARPEDPLAMAQTKGTLRRNFQGYTTDPASALIGLGASSIGETSHGFVQNEPHLGRYEQAISQGRLPIVRGIEITPEDRIRRLIIERLMCDLKVDLSAIAAGSGSSADAVCSVPDALAELWADGIVDVDGTVVQVTPRGRPYIRNVAACFDSYHDAAATRHSVAV